MTGHPWLVANKGRLGFSATDTARWAPEGRTAGPLPWIAVREGLADYRGVPRARRPHQLYARELSPETLLGFHETLRSRGLPPEEYLYLPVHPWQWDETIAPLFASSLAEERIVPLSTGRRSAAAPAVRPYVPQHHQARPAHRQAAAVHPQHPGVARPADRADAGGPGRHRLGAEPARRGPLPVPTSAGSSCSARSRPSPSPTRSTTSCPRPRTSTASCSAVSGASRWPPPRPRRTRPHPRLPDPHRSAGQGPHRRTRRAARAWRPRVWLRRLFAALLPPLLHFLYRYGTVFSPARGERDRRLRRAGRARTARDQGLRRRRQRQRPAAARARTPCPTTCARCCSREPPAFLTQFIHSGLFVGVFRFLAPAVRGTTRGAGGRVLVTPAGRDPAATRRASPS